MSVWDDLVGQEAAVEVLSGAARAAADQLAGGPGAGMTHAWLLTGPAGSGRTNAARAFAAALQCEEAGCGRCLDCLTTVAGSHSDLIVLSTEGQAIDIDTVRKLVRRSSEHPSQGRWLVVVVEDADRIAERSWNVLLKALEEPTARTVWVLCAPSVDDLLVTVRSRCRLVALRTPPAPAIAALLERRDGVDASMASFAARASQGHIGRARLLARDEQVRLRRAEVLELPMRLDAIGSSLVAAANLVEAANEEAERRAGEIEKAELRDLRSSMGVDVETGLPPRGLKIRDVKAQEEALAKAQKARRKRIVADTLGLALVDVLAFYRDVLLLQVGSPLDPVHSDLGREAAREAGRTTPEQTLRRIAVIDDTHRLVTDPHAQANTLLAVEAMAVALGSGVPLLPR